LRGLFCTYKSRKKAQLEPFTPTSFTALNKRNITLFRRNEYRHQLPAFALFSTDSNRNLTICCSLRSESQQNGRFNFLEKFNVK